MDRQTKQRSKQGPALPSRLNKEIENGNSESGPRNERVSKAFALADRKAQRKAKRQQKGQQRLRFTQQNRQDQLSTSPPAESRKRPAEAKQQVQSTGSSPTIPASPNFKYLIVVLLSCQAVKPPAKRPKTSKPLCADRKSEGTTKSTTNKLRQPKHKASKFDELVQGSSLQVCQ